MAMEVDERPTEDYTDIGGLDKQIEEAALGAAQDVIEQPLVAGPIPDEPWVCIPSKYVRRYQAIWMMSLAVREKPTQGMLK